MNKVCSAFVTARARVLPQNRKPNFYLKKWAKWPRSLRTIIVNEMCLGESQALLNLFTVIMHVIRIFSGYSYMK